jgi:hypothetical protein
MNRTYEIGQTVPYHDVLLIRDGLDGEQGARLERFAVDKVTGHFKEDSGANKKPLGPSDEGFRPIMNLGSLGGGTEADPARGPILSALPLHPNPAASCATTCYLVNAQNLNYTTPWTAEEWNDRPEGFNAEGYVRPDAFSLLIASPAGKVYYLHKADGAPLQQQSADFVFREVDLEREPEIWMQLRNGCVVGSVMLQEKDAPSRREKVVPLVNIDSLTPRQAAPQSVRRQSTEKRS